MADYPQMHSVRSTLSMQSMLILGGSGGMPPGKILKFMLEEMQSSGILSQFYLLSSNNDIQPSALLSG